MPGVRKPIVAPKPMGASDIDAGKAAAGGLPASALAPTYGKTGEKTVAGAASAAASRANTEARIAFEREKENRKIALAAAEAAALKEFIDEGTYESPYASLRDTVQGLKKAEEKYAKEQYGTARTNLGTLYGTGTTPSATSARGMTSAGYATLSDWLAKNAPTAYANMPAVTATPMTNVLEQYQRAQGVDPTAVNAAVAAANVAGAGGASNYNALINILKGAETTAQASRMAEAQQARNIADARLLAAYNQQLGGLTTQEAAALNAIGQRYGQRGLDVDTASANRYNALVDRLIALAGYGAYNG
jgi:adenine-specific DNA methylase